MIRRGDITHVGTASGTGGEGGLLAAKFARPQFSRSLVIRQRLIDRLNEGAEGEVTLLTAGPGSGKTLLVAAWAETGRTPGPVAWLSLDGYDNNPAAFWSYLIGALRSTGTVADDNPLAWIRPGPVVDEAFVRQIAEGIVRLPGPMVLVLEDLHEIDNSQVLRSLAFLLRHPLPQLRLIVTTREDRALPLHRPRVRNQLVEIRAAELNFTADEAAELLSGSDVQLTPAQIETLLDRTEGWAAGLGLAAMFLSERGPEAGLEEFAGTERTVAEYLVREVLADHPPDVRRFLLLTSVADRVCGELADVLTGDTNGHRTLERLAGENALVTRLGVQRPWFRYHRLLADLLRHQLRLEMPELVRDLHLKAAQWFAQEDARLYAVHHAVAAQDWPLVGRLVVSMAGARIVSADRRPLMDLLAQVPPHELSTTSGLELSAALLAFDHKDYEAIPGRVAHARALLAEEDPDLRRPAEIVARTLDGSVARARGDMAELVETTADALELLAEVSPAQLPSAAEYRAIALNNAGVGLFWMGLLGPAELRLRSGIAGAESAGAELTQLNAISHLALVDAERGCLQESYGHARSALQLAERRGWRSVLQVVPAYVALALTHLEWYALGEADKAFQKGLAAQRADPEPVQYAALRIAEARILLARGEADAARLVLKQLGWQTDVRSTPLVLARWLAVAEAQIELSAGNPDEVLRINESAEGGRLGPRMQICVARAHLARAEPQLAETVLTPLHTSAPDVGSAAEAWIVTALVEDALRQNNRSAEAFARAVALAEPQNIRRPFVGIGHSRISALLERYQWLAAEKSTFVEALLADSTSTPLSGRTGPHHGSTHRSGAGRPALSPDYAEKPGHRSSDVRLGEHGQGTPEGALSEARSYGTSSGGGSRQGIGNLLGVYGGFAAYGSEAYDDLQSITPNGRCRDRALARYSIRLFHIQYRDYINSYRGDAVTSDFSLVAETNDAPAAEVDPLLASKFAVPEAPPFSVMRERLVVRLSDAVRNPLTAVIGPPGSGKTQLVASWASSGRSPGPIIWITLEDGDDEPEVFWPYFIEGLRRSGIVLSPAVEEAAHGGRFERPVLVRLAADLAAHRTPVVLVLDSVSVLADRQLAVDLDAVLRHADQHLRIVLVGRWDPPLPLYRYRLAGTLAEFRAADLAFTSAETAAL